MSWDIVLLRFRDGDAVAVDADDARRIVLAAEGVRSPTVTRLAYEPARELQMVVFFPSADGWGAAIVDEAAAAGLPDASWSGWGDFDDDFRPPDLRCAVPPPTSKLSSVAHTANGKSGRTGNAGSSSSAVTA